MTRPTTTGLRVRRRTVMPALAALLGFSCIAGTGAVDAAPARRQTPAVHPAEVKSLAALVPLDLEDADLWAAAKSLGTASGVRISVRQQRPKPPPAGEEAEPLPKLTLHAKPIPLAQALSLIAAASEIEWWLDTERGAIILGRPRDGRERFQATASELATLVAAERPSQFVADPYERQHDGYRKAFAALPEEKKALLAQGETLTWADLSPEQQEYVRSLQESEEWSGRMALASEVVAGNVHATDLQQPALVRDDAARNDGETGYTWLSERRSGNSSSSTGFGIGTVASLERSRQVFTEYLRPHFRKELDAAKREETQRALPPAVREALRKRVLLELTPLTADSTPGAAREAVGDRFEVVLSADAPKKRLPAERLVAREVTIRAAIRLAAAAFGWAWRIQPLPAATRPSTAGQPPSSLARVEFLKPVTAASDLRRRLLTALEEADPALLDRYGDNPSLAGGDVLNSLTGAQREKLEQTGRLEWSDLTPGQQARLNDSLDNLRLTQLYNSVNTTSQVLRAAPPDLTGLRFSQRDGAVTVEWQGRSVGFPAQ